MPAGRRIYSGVVFVRVLTAVYTIISVGPEAIAAGVSLDSVCQRYDPTIVQWTLVRSWALLGSGASCGHPNARVYTSKASVALRIWA